MTSPSSTIVRRIDGLTRAKLRTISTATMATILFKRGLRNQFVQNVSRLTKHSRPMVGQAFTLRHVAAREDIDVAAIFREIDHPQRVAVETVPEGDVMVMDCRGDKSAASMGGILATRLDVRGCAGVVSDAGVRDSDYISELDLPVYTASRSAPTNLTRHHAIDINVPVTCGGVVVYPGDVMLGDGDGVMVIPLSLLDEVIEEGLNMEHFELFVTKLVRGGRPVIGTYPANEETLAMYEVYKKENPLEFAGR
ncbi:MAG: ribonuclease activity regulator RraA [Pseudomonadota bacterium]